MRVLGNLATCGLHPALFISPIGSVVLRTSQALSATEEHAATVTAPRKEQLGDPTRSPRNCARLLLHISLWRPQAGSRGWSNWDLVAVRHECHYAGAAISQLLLASSDKVGLVNLLESLDESLFYDFGLLWTCHL